MNPEQIAEWLQANWATIGGAVVIMLLTFGRVRSGDWRGAFRLIVRLIDAVKRPTEPKHGSLRPPISWGGGDNGRKGNGQ